MIKYADGRELDWPAVAFSPRKQNLTLYVIGTVGDFSVISCEFVVPVPRRSRSGTTNPHEITRTKTGHETGKFSNLGLTSCISSFGFHKANHESHESTRKRNTKQERSQIHM